MSDAPKRSVSEEDHAEAHRGPAAHGRLVPDRTVDRRRRREHDGEDRAEKQENDDRGVLGHEGHTIPFPFGQIYENYFIVQSMVRATPIFPRGPLAIDAGCGYTAGRRSASARRRPHSTMHPVNLPEHLILVFAAFCAGTVDAIAGGGGLIIVPALLAVGLPPHLALGTNKGQSLFGSLAAAIRYARAGLVDRDTGRITFPTAFLGALIGTTLVLVIRPEVLRPLVLVLLIVAAILVTIVRPNPRGEPRGSKGGAWWAAGLVALAVGTYDGFFGPGAGTFYIAGFVVFLRLSMARASADAKIANFASNVAAAAIFAHRGVIVWSIALPMAGAQLLGGFLGAHIAVRRGDRLIRALVLAVSLALVIKIGRDLYLGR